MQDNPLQEGIWRVDRQHSEIGFAVKSMWGLQTVRGVFGAYDGSLTVGAGRAEGELRIDAASVDTGHKRRDRHLRSSDFFDVERHPRIVFTARTITARNGGLRGTGQLAIGSSRVRLEVPVNVERTAGGALCLEAETTVSRKAAGVDWNMLGVIRGDAVVNARITLERGGVT